MNKTESHKIVRETFENSFDKEKFIYFVKNLLNSFDDAPFVYRGNFIPDAYEKHISVFERIAKYSDGKFKIDILIVYLKKETSIERARSMQRNFIAWYLNGSRGNDLKDAALVAFVSPNSSDWRFSLVKMDYKLEEGNNGRMKVKEEFTPARRWSFLVGANENSHTAQSRLAPIMEDDQNNPVLKQLEDAFDIEKVTKEFFEKYRDLFLRVSDALNNVIENNQDVKKDFKEKNVSIADFSKKLLGQIVFLYFLQKKGWFGVPMNKTWGDGDKRFLRTLFKKALSEGENYFNDYLEPLFYEALAKERDDDFYSRFDCKIPFLNGGLFDPISNYDWVNTVIDLPDDLFSNTRVNLKTGDKGDGVLDMFDRYNFTVKEDEPLEKEVAIDPEMLGKVFENLLEVKDRKSKGTYYTPREIVHYMCEQSLVNYLVSVIPAEAGIQCPAPTQEDIATLIKYGETVAEHEAEVINRDNETKTYFYKLPKSIRDNAKEIDEKLAAIKVCDPAIGSGAFPVGMMNEIVKTRLALNSYLTNPATKQFRTAYNFKRHAIQNSLYGVDIDPGAVEIAKLRLWLSLVVDEDDIKQIKPLPNLDYKIVCGNSLLGVEKNLFNTGLFNELEKLKPLFFNETSGGKKKEYKKRIEDIIAKLTNGRKDFDFEIYFSEVFHEKEGFDVVIGNPPYVNIFNIKDENYRSLLKSKYKVYKNKTDLYAFFAEKGLDLLKKNGKLVYIFSNSWLGTDSFSKFREFLINETKINKLIKCQTKVFEHATVSVVIIILSKENVSKNEIELLEFTGKEFKKIDSKLSYDFIRKQVAYGFTFDKLFEIKIPFIKLGEIAKFSLGIKTSDNKRFISDSKRSSASYKILRGKDIGRYFEKFNNKWVWYKPDLMNQRKGAGPRKLDCFLRTKILIKDVATEIQATLDTENYLTADTINIIYEVKNYDLKFILAILNSKLMNRWFKMNFTAGLHIKINQLENIPIPKKVKQKPFINLVDQILEKKKNNPEADIGELEREIDGRVFELYRLGEKEIGIAEGEV